MTTRLLVPLMMAGLAGYVLRGLLARQAARGAGGTPAPALPFVRDAGPEAMADPPRKWDIVDEMADESFPASDPPGTY